MKPLIEIRDLSKTYKRKDHATEALRAISFTVLEGEIAGIIGMSGAGKSTLIRCLAHLELPTSGQILFSGKDIASFNSAELRAFRKDLGMIFQHFNLLSSRTVWENV